MRCKSIKYFLPLILLSVCPLLKAQQPMTEEEQQKKIFEMIEQQVDKYTSLLDLEDWQIFYVDSILTHDYLAMQEELKSLSAAKMSFQDAYIKAQDKWSEAMYQAFHKVFNDAQWERYLKTGGARDKKARDKREAKRNQ